MKRELTNKQKLTVELTKYTIHEIGTMILMNNISEEMLEVIVENLKEIYGERNEQK